MHQNIRPQGGVTRGVLKFVLGTCLALAATASPIASAQLLGDDDDATGSLLGDPEAVTTNPEDSTVALSIVATPAGDAIATLTFDLPEGWHMYGPFQNGSGAPPIVDWTLPPSAELGGTAWPTPERYLSGGIVLDHVYHHQAEVQTTLTGLTPGTDVEASIEWLVCDADRCVPVFADVSATVAAIDTNQLPYRRSQERFDPALNDIAAWWDASELVITGDQPLVFVPTISGSTIENLPETGQSSANTLRLTPTWNRGDGGGTASHVAGILILGSAEPASDPASKNSEAPRSIWLSVPRNGDQVPEAPWTIGGKAAFAWKR